MKELFFGSFFSEIDRQLVALGSEYGLGLTLFSLTVSIQARTIIEIGRFKGFSTFAFAAALRFLDEGHMHHPVAHRQRPDVDYAGLEATCRRMVISIDLTLQPEVMPMLSRWGLERYVQLINHDSKNVRLDGQCDILFIDGDHSYEGCLADWQNFQKNLRPGGYLILHDYFGWYLPGDPTNRSPIKRVCEDIIEKSDFEHLLIDTRYMSFMLFRRPDGQSSRERGREKQR